jgi:hypothetical protein
MFIGWKVRLVYLVGISLIGESGKLNSGYQDAKRQLNQYSFNQQDLRGKQGGMFGQT